jgi:hypothetical protein
VTVSKESTKAAVTLDTFDSSGNLISSNATTAAYGSAYIMRVDVTNASGSSCSTNLNNGTIPPINTIPCPTGNVSITDNGAALNDFTNSNSGVASNVAPLNSQGFFEDQPIQLPGGNHSIVAAYAGDTSYTSSTSAADAISITKAGTGVTMNPIPNASVNFPITLGATVTTASSGVGPTGTMTFTSGGTTLGTAPVIGTAAILTPFAPAIGTTTFAATFTTAGAKSVTATYSGDSNYSPSGPSGAISVNVTSSGTFNITASPVTVTAGSSGVSTVTVTPSGGFTGSVQVSCAGTGLPPGVSCSPNPLTIAISGTAPVTAALTVMVAGPSTTLSASRISHQHPLYAAAIAIPPTNSNGTHQIAHLTTWWSLSAISGLASVLLLLFPGLRPRNLLRSAFGLGLLSVLSFTLGCGGGRSSGGGGGGNQVASHTTLTVTNAKQASNNNFAFNVTVTSSGASPTGQVQLFDGSTALGLPVSLSNGTASINSGLATVGTHAVSAHYLGNATTLASASGSLNLIVTGPTTVPLTSTPSGSANISLTIQ